MFVSRALRKYKVNLNEEHWNRRVWEKGYVGPPLPKIKRTGVPPIPITEGAVTGVQRALMREWNVMQWLANPYLNEEMERPYLERYGDIIDEWRQREIEAKQRKMPSKPKFTQVVNGEVEKRRANVGNLLHSHRTVEDQMKALIRRNRWD